MKKRQLQIDPEFLNLTVPISEKETEQLERSLLRDGCLEPVVTWNGIILDGHKRFQFCSCEEIPYELEEMEFASRDEAILWICRNRILGLASKRLIYKYLVGKWCNIQKPAYKEMYKKNVGEKYRDADGRFRVSKVFSEELGITYYMVERSCSIAKALDRLSETEPALARLIIMEEIAVEYKEIIQIGKNDPKALHVLRRKAKGGQEKSRQGRIRQNKQENEPGISIAVGIKEMPAFDPDMEIRGLTFTIPTWMEAIRRAEQRTDMALTTDGARQQLATQLQRLQEQIKGTLEAIG